MPIKTVAGGTFADVGVLNVNQDGDETLEVWTREASVVSGAVSQPAPGEWAGATDFSEFGVAAGLPAGITAFGISNESPTVHAIANDVTEGNYFSMSGHPAGVKEWAYGLDAFDNLIENGEMLARIWVPNNEGNRHDIGPVFSLDGLTDLTLDFAGGGLHKRTSIDFESMFAFVTNGNSNLPLSVDLQEAEQSGVWMWLRVRRLANVGTPANDDSWAKGWYGAIGDEPVGWDGTDVNRVGIQRGINALGWGIIAVFNNAEQRIAFLSFSSDPVNFPPASGALPTVFGPWVLKKSVTVAAVADQVVRVDGLTIGKQHEVALRYRRGVLFNAGAENTGDPTTWPSVSRGTFTTTVDPPTFVSGVWDRTSAIAEQISVTVTPLVGSEAAAINFYREEVGDGAPTFIGTIAGPHVGDITFVDTTINGEKAYLYTFTTGPLGVGEGAQSTQNRVWSGPPEIPVFTFAAEFSGGYIAGFANPADTVQGIELWDDYDNLGGVGAFALRATVDPIGGIREVAAPFLLNVPVAGIAFSGRFRFKQTDFAVVDYGENSAPPFDLSASGGP